MDIPISGYARRTAGNSAWRTLAGDGAAVPVSLTR